MHLQTEPTAVLIAGIQALLQGLVVGIALRSVVRAGGLHADRRAGLQGAIEKGALLWQQDFPQSGSQMIG